MNFDELFFNSINDLVLKSGIPDCFLVFFAKYLGYILIFALLLFLIKDYRKFFFLPVIALLSGFFARYVIVDIVRLFYYKPRPFVKMDVIPLFEHADTSSFPSGHMAFFFALSAIVFLYNKKAGWFFFAGSFLIGFSRIASGIHWPFDIVAGAIIGILVSYLIFLLSPTKNCIPKRG